MMKKKEYVKPESMVIPVECVFICSVSTSGGPSTHKDGDLDDNGPTEEESDRPSKNFIFSDEDDHFEYQDALFGNF